jgi:hypothetical protein
MLCSCSLKTFYELIEDKIEKSGKTQDDFVTEFLSLLEDELPDVCFCFDQLT